MIVNTSVVIEFVKSFAIITRKEAGDGPYLKKILTTKIAVDIFVPMETKKIVLIKLDSQK